MDELVVNKWILPRNSTNVDSKHYLANKNIVKIPSFHRSIVPHIRQLKKKNTPPILQSNGANVKNVQAPPANIYAATPKIYNHEFKIPLPVSPKIKVIIASPLVCTSSQIQKTELIHQQSTASSPVMAKKNMKFQPKAQQVTESRCITKIPMSIKAPLISDQKPCSLLLQKVQYQPSGSIVSKQISSFQLSKNPKVLVPLPSKFKSVNATSIQHQSNDVKGGNLSMPFKGHSSQKDSNFGECGFSQKQINDIHYHETSFQRSKALHLNNDNPKTNLPRKETAEILSSTIVSIGRNVINNEISTAVGGKSDEKSIHSKLSCKLNPIKGMPWSFFTGNKINELKSSTIPQPNAIPQVSTNRILNNRTLIKLPSNWKLRNITPAEATDIIKTMKHSTVPHNAYGGLRCTINKNHSGQSVMTAGHAKIVEPTFDNADIEYTSATKRNQSTSALINKSSLSDNAASRPFAFQKIQEESDLTESTNPTLDGEPKIKKKKTDDDKENDRLDIILEELHQIRKQEVKNSANMKLLIRKIVEEDVQTRSFTFPLKTEIELKKFEDCLLKPRFTTKLVSSLENKIYNCTDKVSELVEIIFHPQLLSKYNVSGVTRGLQPKESFEKLKINQIFLDLSGLSSKEYYSDLTRVINKMHMRHTRHPGECE